VPSVSIVIRTYNEERHLPALLNALSNQDYGDTEVIVVDSGSIDSTRQIAATRAAKVLRVRPEDFTFGHSLNVGLTAATCPQVAIVSAHTLPVDSSWLRNLISALTEERVAIVYGRQLASPHSKLGEAYDLARSFDTRRSSITMADFFGNNANSAIRRELWNQRKFDESLPGLEDAEWARHWMSLGWKVIYEPSAALYHFHDETWDQVRHRYRREAQAAARLGLNPRRPAAWAFADQARYFALDMVTAAGNGSARRVGELARFRWEKAMGTARGLAGSKARKATEEHRGLYFDKGHRAVVIHGPHRASLDVVDTPILRPGEVLVRVAYVGICATDLEILKGSLGYYKSGLAKYPIIPGHEFSGRVVAVGSRVRGFGEGDRVVVECIQGCGACTACQRMNPIGCEERTEVGVIGRDGGYADYVATNARFLHRVPQGLSLKYAAVCEPMAVVIKGLRRLQSAWGSESGSRRCAVVGGGPIGHLAARTLAGRGHQVTVLDRDPVRLELLKGHQIAVASGLEMLPEFDAVIEATGDPEALHSILHQSRAGVTILLLGLPYGHREFSFESIVGYDKTIVGSVGSSGQDFEEAICTLPSIDLRAFASAVFPLERYPEAWEISESRKHLKVLLEIQGE
jgi:threonine dehydrogenase-like Zn-dependent dehydrogenase/GT2 family glycosyltransferase